MRLLLGLIFIISTVSCTNSAFYKSDTQVNGLGWGFENKLNYDFDIENTNQNYDLIVNVKHGKFYAYSNLYLFVDVNDPNNNSRRDTIECFLASPIGRWYGKSESENIVQQFMYRPNINFPIKGKYQIQIQQGMRDTLLKNISSVGIELRETIINR